MIKQRKRLPGKMKETLVKELGVSESVVSVSAGRQERRLDAEMQKIPEEAMFIKNSITVSLLLNCKCGLNLKIEKTVLSY